MLMACQVILGQDCKPKGKKCKKLEGECVTDCKTTTKLKCKKKFCKGGKGCACKYTKEKKPVSCEQDIKCDKLGGICGSMAECKANKKLGLKCKKNACKGKKCGCSYVLNPTASPSKEPTVVPLPTPYPSPKPPVALDDD